MLVLLKINYTFGFVFVLHYNFFLKKSLYTHFYTTLLLTQYGPVRVTGCIR